MQEKEKITGRLRNCEVTAISTFCNLLETLLHSQNLYLSAKCFMEKNGHHPIGEINESTNVFVQISIPTQRFFSYPINMHEFCNFETLSYSQHLVRTIH